MGDGKHIILSVRGLCLCVIYRAVGMPEQPLNMSTAYHEHRGEDSPPQRLSQFFLLQA